MTNGRNKDRKQKEIDKEQKERQKERHSGNMKHRNTRNKRIERTYRKTDR